MYSIRIYNHKQAHIRIARKFHGIKFSWFSRICPRPRKFSSAKTIFKSLIMAIGSESAKIKSRKLSRMSFHENFTPRNFLAIRYTQTHTHTHAYIHTQLAYLMLMLATLRGVTCVLSYTDLLLKRNGSRFPSLCLCHNHFSNHSKVDGYLVSFISKFNIHCQVIDNILCIFIVNFNL